MYCTAVDDVYEGSEELQMTYLTVSQTSLGLDHNDVPVAEGRAV